MTITAPSEATLRTADLSPKKPNRFAIEPTAEARAAIARDLGLDKLPKLRMTGAISAEGAQGWRLEADLGATVVQPCVVTLDPVTTRIDETVARRFLPAEQLPDLGDEAESPEDDGIEALGPGIALWDIMVEALALAIPPYPRKDDAERVEAAFAEDGVTPLKDADLKPFAGLAALRDKLAQDGPEEPE